MRQPTRALAFALLLFCVAIPRHATAAEEERPGTAKDVISAAEQEGKLTIYSTTDSALVQPLLKDFASLYPKIPVEYTDMNSTELYNRVISEAAAGSVAGELLLKAAVDLHGHLPHAAGAPGGPPPQGPPSPHRAGGRHARCAPTLH